MNDITMPPVEASGSQTLSLSHGTLETRDLVRIPVKACEADAPA